MYSFCLLASMELILIPNCSILYLHSNNRNSSKSLFMKKVIAINILSQKLQIKSECNSLIGFRHVKVFSRASPFDLWTAMLEGKGLDNSPHKNI